jgi:hypothetical protein
MAKQRPYSLMEIHNRLETIQGKKISKMNLFELSIISAMPGDIHREIRKRLDLALMYLEDGAEHTAANILRKFLRK